jgi:RNA polymerase sigma-70 factor (ECF subfamily)
MATTITSPASRTQASRTHASRTQVAQRPVPTLATLAHAAQDGDPEALAELFRRVVPKARRVAASYCSRSDLDDAVAEGFARALTRLAQLREPGAVEAWIVRCVVRAATDLARRHSRQLLGGSAADLETRQAHDVRLRPLESSAADGALSAIDRLSVKRALARLPEGYRQLLWLRFHAGLSVKDIAQWLSLPEGTARRRCFEATRLLEEQYLIDQLCPASGDCVQMTALMCRSVRRPLGPTTSRRLDAHLLRCRECRARRKALDELRPASRQYPATAG